VRECCGSSVGFFSFADGSWPQASISHDHMVRNFWADEARATAICYGQIAAGTALAVVAVVNAPD
jgi:hypothetical protein